MEKQEIRTDLLKSLSVLYDMEILAPLMKFLQGELRVLYYLYQHIQDTVYISQLSDWMVVSRSRVTALINSLKKKGYIKLEPCEHDRRRIKVCLTEDGIRYTKEQQEMAYGYFDKLIEGFGEKDMKELIRLIDLAVEVMTKQNKED